MRNLLVALTCATTLLLAGCSDGGEDVVADDLEGTTTTAEAPAEPTTSEAPDETTTSEAPDEPTTSAPSGGLETTEVAAGIEDALASSLFPDSNLNDFDEAEQACMVEEIVSDPPLAQELVDNAGDPAYVPSGTSLSALFAVMDTCEVTGMLAESMVAGDPSLSLDQAQCLVDGMVGLPPETWDAIMATTADPTANPDFFVLQDFLQIFDDCGVDPMTLA